MAIYKWLGNLNDIILDKIVLQAALMSKRNISIEFQICSLGHHLQLNKKINQANSSYFQRNELYLHFYSLKIHGTFSHALDK